ncbi:hypothetical protein [Oceanicola sp. 22II-s10i]|uniref:hypothetical protein n=1 Tax=Oceanicola sp. 22II-s10i TaxID=1317116 RepID=UPI00113281C7|nr:hypothetical protein [Oceanicola sp. 22II-s10i]
MAGRGILGAASVLTVLLAVSGQAQTFACGPWMIDGAPVGPPVEIGVFMQALVYSADDQEMYAHTVYRSGARKTYLDASSVIVVYGQPVPGTDDRKLAPPLTVVRLIYGAQDASISRLECKDLSR